MSELLPAGRYNARATDAKAGKTSKGSEQVAVEFEITAPEIHAGRRITAYLYLTEKTVDRTLESLEHCGWDGVGFSVDSLATVRGEASIVIEHEEDQNGEPRARVKWVNSIGGLALKEELDAASVIALEQRLKGKLLARKQSRPVQPKPAAKPAARGRNGDPDYGGEEFDPFE